MKKKSTTIILIVLIIGLIGSGIAFYAIKNNENPEDTNITSSTIETSNDTTEPQTQISTQSDDNITQISTSNTVTTTKANNVYFGDITVTEAFDLLEAYYGKDYEINCLDYNETPPVFFVTDKNTFEKYASVTVDLGTGTATETNASTNETREFSLFG